MDMLGILALSFVRLLVLIACLLWLFPHLEWYHGWLIALGLFFAFNEGGEEG